MSRLFLNCAVIGELQARSKLPPQGMGVNFVDMSNEDGLKITTWSQHVPDWRKVIRGLCREGEYTTEACHAYSQQVVIGIGMSKFDLVLDVSQDTCKCPICHKYVEPIRCGFNNFDWRWSGIKQMPGKAPEKCSSGDGWRYADDAYHYFDESISGEVTWRQLLFETREHQ